MVVLTTLALSFALASSTDEAPKIGQMAPPIRVEQVYGPKSFPTGETFSWESMKGQVVVLEFTASWCGPCIKAIPHINSLVQAMKKEPVIFLSISNESDATIKKLMSDYPFDTIVARDVDGSVFGDYWVAGIPHAVIIDKEGKVGAITSPTNISEKVLRDVLAGKAVKLPLHGMGKVNWDSRPANERGELLTGNSSVKPEGSVEAYLIPSSKGHLVFSDAAKGSELFISSLGFLIGQAYLSQPCYHVYETTLPLEENFEAYLRSARLKGRDWRYIALQRLLEASFDFEADWERRSVDCYVLKLKEGVSPPAEPKVAERNIFTSEGHLWFRKLPFAQMVKFMEPYVPEQRPLVNETGLKGELELQLKWDPKGGLPAFTKALGKAGIELIKGKRTVDMLVFRKPSLRRRNPGAGRIGG
jgi:uncharacterized protein (TIGR03435 family)